METTSLRRVLPILATVLALWAAPLSAHERARGGDRGCRGATPSRSASVRTVTVTRTASPRCAPRPVHVRPLTCHRPSAWHDPYWFHGHDPFWYGPRIVVPVRPPEGFGWVKVNVRPRAEAEVFVDGMGKGLASAFGGTPGYLVLPAGDHRLRVTVGGVVAYDERIRVESGETLVIKRDLRPRT
jgi:hypothetical protein